MTKQENKGFAIASLVTSIIGFVGFFVPYIAIAFSIVGIIFSVLQKKHGDNGMATAGMVLGILGVIGNIIWSLIVLALFSIGA